MTTLILITISLLYFLKIVFAVCALHTDEIKLKGKYEFWLLLLFPGYIIIKMLSGFIAVIFLAIGDGLNNINKYKQKSW